MATFTTSRSVGQTIAIIVTSSSGFWKYNHNGVDSTTKYVSSTTTRNIPIANANGEFTIIPCLSDGTVSGNITRISLNHTDNEITSFDGTGFSGITRLDLNSRITSFNGNGLSGVTTLYLTGVTGFPLTSFNGSGMTSLVNLSALNVGSSIDTFIFPSSLTELSIMNSQVSSFNSTGLGLTNLKRLTFLMPGLQIGLLQSVDITALTNLERLNVSRNQLTSLNTSGLTKLTHLTLNSNQLTTFSGSANLALLKELNLENNPLTSIDLTGLINLDSLYLLNTQLTAEDNDLVLSQMVANGFNAAANYWGWIELGGGRTVSGTSDFNTLKSGGWQIYGADLPFEVPVTIVTSKPSWSSISFTVATTTGYWMAQENGRNSAIFTSSGTITIKTNGQFKIVSCDQLGNITGNILQIISNNSEITAFDSTVLSNLTILELSNNQIASLDVNGLTGLTDLNLSNNQIASLDVNGLTALTNLNLSYNQIASLDVNGLTALTNLDLTNNQITSFNGTSLSNLTNLNLQSNPLTTFIGGDMGQLTSLNFQSWQISTLTSFDGTGLVSLTELYLDGNNQLSTFIGGDMAQLTELYLHLPLTSFNGAGLINLTNLSFATNLLTSIDDFTFPSSLTSLQLGNQGEFNEGLTSFDSTGSGLSGLTSLQINGNPLTSFNASELINLTNLSAYDCQITSLDNFAFPSSLTSLYFHNNQLTSFDGNGLSNLTYLNLNGNIITTFDGTGLSNLASLYLEGNPLTTFIGGDMSQLTALSLYAASFTSFAGSNMTGLTQLNLSGQISNSITSLDNFAFPSNLNYLYLNSNQLTSFNGTGLSNLVELEIADNQLTSFNGTGLSSLAYLAIPNNPLTTFIGGDMGQITSLNFQDWNITTLTSFDATGLSSLTNLDLQNNPITPSVNNQILDKLSMYGLSGGQFSSNNGRYAISNADYNSLVDLGWSFYGLDLVSGPVVGNGKIRVRGIILNP